MTNFWQRLKKPIIGMAPMDGVTDFPMREITALIAKPDVIYTEFVSIEGFSRKPEVFLPKLKFSGKQRPIVAQLFGSNPESFSKVIPEIAKLGFDGIDINMGCPSKNILEQGGGGALIGKYDLVERIIKSSLSVLSQLSNLKPLSVKTRIMENFDETKRWLEFLSEFPISAICVHARPLKQLHSGIVQFEQLEQLVQLFKSKRIIFLGNGGIKNRKEGVEISQKYGFDGILIGRAAIGNPWVFKENYKDNKGDLVKTILKHSRIAWDFYKESGFLSIRKHLCAYCKNFANSKKIRVKLSLVKDLEDIEKIINDGEIIP